MKSRDNTKKEIIWLSIARSFAVLFVVINHIIPRGNSTFESAGLLWKFNDIISFHMALFFFISGYLIYHTKIKNDCSYSYVIKNQAARIIYPYVFITVAVYFIKILLSSYIKNPLAFSFNTFIDSFIYPSTNPWMILWFLNSMLICILLYPIFKKAVQNKYTIILTGFIIILLNLFIPKNIRFLDLSTVVYYLIFFYAGVLGGKYGIERFIKKHLFGISFLTVFILANIFNWDRLFHNFSGIGVSIYLSNLCANYLPRIFSSFKNYYYQIYLFSTFFQAIVLELFLRLGIEQMFLIFCLTSILSAIYIPVVLSKLVVKINWNPLLKVFGF